MEIYFGIFGRENDSIFATELVPATSHAISIVVCPQFTIARMDYSRLLKKAITFSILFLHVFSSLPHNDHIHSSSKWELLIPDNSLFLTLNFSLYPRKIFSTDSLT